MSSMTRLTPEGRRYAESHRESIVARVALMGEASGWPWAHVATAIKACNEQGEDAQRAAAVDVLVRRGDPTQEAPRS